MAERIFAICIAAGFGFLPYAVKGMPNFIAWIGISGAVLIGGLTFAPINPRLVMPAGFVIVCAVGLITASSWLYLRYYETPRASPDAIAHLAGLGWAVKPSQEGILFEIAGSSLPPMEESAMYFAQLDKPFRLHFQSVKGLEGLHYLAGIANCFSIEINAGEFTDISELRGFSHLSKLMISQVPLNGVGVVDASALSTLINLQELGLGMTRVRFAEPLASLKMLKSLYLGQTLISDLSPISGLSLVEKLDIRDSRVTDLAPLATYKNLTDLTVSGEQVPGLINLAHLQNLKRLILIDQHPTDLAPIGTLTNLESLFVWALPQFDLMPLRSLTKLQNLQLGGTGFGRPLPPVANVQAIENLKELKTLTIGYLQITDLNFTDGFKNLVELNLNQLPIIDITPLRRLLSLKKLSLSDVPVVDISPLLDLPRLTDLSILRVPARADILKELERRGVKIAAN